MSEARNSTALLYGRSNSRLAPFPLSSRFVFLDSGHGWVGTCWGLGKLGGLGGNWVGFFCCWESFDTGLRGKQVVQTLHNSAMPWARV